MSKEKETSASKAKLSATPKKRKAGRMTKLNSSSWYESAIRSISISKGKPHEKRDAVIE